MDILIILISHIVLALAALRWGVNSADDINSTEWERRQRWYSLNAKEAA